MKPLILLDVDGTINVITSAFRRKHLVYHEGWVTQKVHLLYGIYRLTADPTLGARLCALAQETNAELVWATTWEWDANRYVSPLIGLPELPVLPVENCYNKAATVVPATNGRPFIWFDDDASLFGGCARHCGETQLWDLIITDPEIGITNGDLATARERLGIFNGE